MIAKMWLGFGRMYVRTSTKKVIILCYIGHVQVILTMSVNRIKLKRDVMNGLEYKTEKTVCFELFLVSSEAGQV
jgi:hypothetical protein